MTRPLRLGVSALLAATVACAAGFTSSIASEARRGRKLTETAQYDRAHVVLLAALERAEVTPAPSLDRALAFYCLGDLYFNYPSMAEPGAAAGLFGRALAEYESVLGPDHPAVGVVLARRGEVLREDNETGAARADERRAMAIFQKAFPEEHPIREFYAAQHTMPIHPDQLMRAASASASGTTSESPPGETPVAVDASGTYLQRNVTLEDGSHGFLHVTPADMPLVVSIGYPRRPPRDGSSKRTREVAIEAMQMWEAAIQPHLPWFRLVFVKDDPEAAVQIEWKRRITGPWGGFGGIRWWPRPGGGVRVGGAMQISTTPDNFVVLEIADVRLLVAHEFGHVLGLGHCLDCDSAMNYSWATQGRVLVTDLDVRTFLALVAQPNAFGGD